MKTTQQLEHLGQNPLDNWDVRCSQNQRLSIYDIAPTFPAPAIQIGWQEESL